MRFEGGVSEGYVGGEYLATLSSPVDAGGLETNSQMLVSPSFVVRDRNENDMRSRRPDTGEL